MKYIIVTMFICISVLFSGLSFSIDSAEDDYYAVIYIVDGLHPDLLTKMVALGELPNIKKCFYDNGMVADNCITIFPSITLPCMTSILTGVYPSTHRIPGFQWFDRENFAFRCYIGAEIRSFDNDFKKHATSLFNYFEPEDSASFGLVIGSDHGTDDSMMFTALNPLHDLAPFTHLMLSDIMVNLNIRESRPHLLALYEWAIILRSYKNSFRGKKVCEVLYGIDEKIGKLIDNYEDKGLKDKTYFFLLSDHGLAETDKSFYIDEMLQDEGFKKKLISYNLGESYVPFSLDRDRNLPLVPFYIDRVDSLFGIPILWKGYNVLVGSNAGGVAMLYLARNGGFDKNNEWSKEVWKAPVYYEHLEKYYLGPEKGYFNLLEYLKNIEGLDFFIVRENSYDPSDPEKNFKVRVVSKRGDSLITRKGSKSEFMYRYEVLSGVDPLSYDKEPNTKQLMDNKFHSGDDWFKASYTSNYPDACVQLTQIMEFEQAGSVMLSCAGKWSVNSKVVSKHGGLLREEMRSTFCISGPGIKQGTIPSMRTVDIVPSILYLLNKDVDYNTFDGKVIEAAKEAVENRKE